MAIHFGETFESVREPCWQALFTLLCVAGECSRQGRTCARYGPQREADGPGRGRAAARQLQHQHGAADGARWVAACSGHH